MFHTKTTDKLEKRLDAIDLQLCRWAYENLEHNDPLMFADVVDGVDEGLTPLDIKLRAKRRAPEEGRKVDQMFNAAMWAEHLQRGE